METNRTIIVFLAAIDAGVFFYVALNSLMGQAAFEEKKVRERLRSLIHLKREAIMRKTNVSTLTALNEVLSHSRWLTLIDELIKLTNWNITAGGFLILELVLFSGALMLGYLFLNDLNLILLIAIVLSGAPFFYLWMNRKSYINKFVNVFPDVLGMMKNAVAAGQGVQMAIKTIAEEGPLPVSKEFARVVGEIELGSHMDESLNGLYKRVPSMDVRLFVLGLLIQMEVGGNLGDLFQNISKTIRDRITLKREMGAATAQAKMSAVVLMALPLLLAGALQMVSPGFLEPLFKEDLGHKILMLAGALWIVGAVVVFKMTNVVSIV